MEKSFQWKGEICKVLQRKQNLSWALQSKDGTIGIRTEVTVRAKAYVLSSMVRAQNSGPMDRGTGCPRKRKHSETRSWKETQSGKPWMPTFHPGVSGNLQKFWAMETPDELCLGRFIRTMLPPFMTGNKIRLYLHASLSHSTLPLFGNPSNLFFFLNQFPGPLNGSDWVSSKYCQDFTFQWRVRPSALHLGSCVFLFLQKS